MAEFAGVAKEGVDIAKDLAVEVRDELVGAFHDHKHLTLIMDDKPLEPKLDTTDKFQWVVDSVVVYRSAYNTHIRATTSSQKKHAEKVRTKLAERGVAKDQRKQFKKDLDSTARTLLVNNYARKHKANLAAIESQVKEAVAVAQAEKQKDPLISVPDLAKTIHDRRRAMYNEFMGKYRVQIPDGCSDQAFANIIADGILKSSEFDSKFARFWKVALDARAENSVTNKNPKLASKQVKEKLIRKEARQIESAFHTSAAFCYAVSFQVLKIDDGDVKDRWTKLDAKLKAYEDTESKRLRDAATENAKLINEWKTGGMSEEDLAVRRAEHQAELDAEKAKVNADIAAKREALAAKKDEVKAYLAKNPRRMGAFYFGGIPEHKGLQTGIRFPNTDVTVTAKANYTLSGQGVELNLTWRESGHTGLPFLKGAADQALQKSGQIIFKSDGSFEVMGGAMGKRFADLNTKSEEKRA